MHDASPRTIRMNQRETMPAARILHVDDQPETHEWLKLALEREFLR